MSKFGIKIKNIEAGSIYGVNLGVREQLDFTDAMFTNSLFCDFLLENGLSVWKGKSTRDIICLEFNYGTSSYDEEVNKFTKKIKEAHLDRKLDNESRNKLINRYNELLEQTHKNKELFRKKSKDEIRMEFYTKGVDITYHSYNKNGNIIDSETIHYKMLYRTPGKAKKGSCMFIREELYDISRNFLYMGIKLPEEHSPIVEIGAYSSLITSTIVGKIQIKPEQILVINDVDSFFKTKVISIETDENKHCHAIPKENYRVKNTMFDGQALIDDSIFPEWGEGYILLRQHMCKVAAFHSKIQKFFKEYYGDAYDYAVVEDMFGRQVAVKDIKLITTDNAMKWLKFNVSYEYWSDWVRGNDCMFGIVKTAHPSKLGEVQRMSYQMINALELDSMEQVVKKSMDYIDKLKTDNEVFIDYLRKNSNFSNDFDVLIALYEHNPEFYRSEYFRTRRESIIETYVSNFKTGKVIQNADNLVGVGSPFAMLLAAVGEDPLSDPTFEHEDGTIQVWTERFNDGEYLAEFRSPFNSKNNMGYVHNHYHEYFDRYFHFGPQIIAANVNGTDFQDRNNGSDFDSDSFYVTNQPEIVECARKCYANYPTIVNNIPKEQNIYSLSIENYAKIDSNLQSAQLAIGESSNMAQICLTYTYNFEDTKYSDYVCILSVLAQVAIDNAKRSFDVSLPDEIARIKRDMDIKKNGYPKFWLGIRPNFNRKRINNKLVCPMNYIYDLKIKKHHSTETTLPMLDFFIKHSSNLNRRQSKKVEELIQNYSIDLLNYRIQSDNFDSINSSQDTARLILQSDFDQLIEDIKGIYISNNYADLMSWLIDRAFLITPGVRRNTDTIASNTNKNKAILMKTLYSISPNVFLSCFKKKCTLNCF